ncbi:MAG: amidohydrolase family protein, partial [Acidimicrobiales bacterium]|nr:amidohydrolase family protein [Acidimicrobiales bacterium]
HQHLVFDGSGTLEAQVADRSDADLAERARRAARRALEGGVTTLRDLGDRGYVTLALRDDPALPTMACAGPPITPTQGHCWYLGGECPDRDALVRAVDERAERGCDVVKIMVTGGMMTPTTPMWMSQFAPDDLRLAVDRAHAAGLPVAAHCHGIDGIAEAIDAGVDTIEHCTFLNEAMEPDPDAGLLERLARSGIPISATLGSLPGAPLPPRYDTIASKVRAATVHVLSGGGTIVVGTDAGIDPFRPHDVAPHALEDLETLGLSAERALRAMTRDGADALGLTAKGRLTRGADADLLAVDGDPFTDAAALTRVAGVWKAGVPVVPTEAA